jgi:phage-related protein
MPAITGDFIGFTFGGVSSQQLGIVRVSDGSRYKQALLPNFSDKTINVPGANKTIYLGTEYTGKNFPLSIAFDSVTEQQIRQMQTLFSTTKPLPLVFDEMPYKTYYVKAASAPQISYICFDEKGQRIYKGEGTIDLVSYFPYGFCNPRELTNIFAKDNKDEWLAASGLDTTTLGKHEVYNPGDFDTPFWCKIVAPNLTAGSIRLDDEHYLEWEAGADTSNKNLSNDIYIIIDGRNQLIEGYSADGVKSGRIYNKYITGGNWFNLPVGLERTTLEIEGTLDDDIQYNILYI